MNALAFTQGNDIHFAPGRFASDQSGQELLGHELTHVMQQREGRAQPRVQGKGLAIDDSPDLEREADELGARAARGQDTPYRSRALSMRNAQRPIQAKSAPVQLKLDSHFGAWHDEQYQKDQSGNSGDARCR